jgi:hypothetical protein
MENRIGIIAGSGVLPCIVATEAKRRGYSVLIIALDPIADSIDRCGDRVERINVGKLGKIIKTLKRENIREAVMAGKVPKTLMYRGNIIPDTKALKLLFKLKDRKDDTIMQTITEEFESEGIRILKTIDFTSSLMMPEGCLTKRTPSDDEWKDIEFGFRLAKEIGRLDIGQTVVVKNRAVMAVEAIEGTDEAILRGGKLAEADAVVVKVSKPQQDFRYDVPVVGVDTLKSMLQVKARVLALEAGKTIVLQRDEVINIANREGISIVGVSFK